jgi:hypothetical protein
MDAKRREELVERRRQLQEQRREQHRRAMYYWHVEWIASQLERRGAAFSYCHELEPLERWLRANFPFIDEEIDCWGLEYRRLTRFRFTRDEAGEILTHPTREATVQRWLQSVRNLQRLEDERVTAFYGRRTPALELSFDDVMRHPAVVFNNDGWLIPPSRAWVLQFTNGELAWARPAPEFASPLA